MNDGAFTYANENKEAIPDECTSLKKSSEELGLVIEVYSTEPGMCFAEHFHYDHGEELASEVRTYEEFYYDEDEDYTKLLKEEKSIECTDNFEAFSKLYELTDDDFEQSDAQWASKGGFGQDWEFFDDSDWSENKNGTDIEKD